MRSVLIAAAALTLAGCTAKSPTALSCSSAGAVYHLRGQAGPTLHLVKPPHPVGAASDLMARVDLDGQSWWFSFTSSNGYSHDYLLSEPDPFKEEAEDQSSKDDDANEDDNGETSELIAFDAAYNLLNGLPQSGGKAPAHILATGIGTSLWYSTPRRELNKSIWDLAACNDKAAR